MALKKYDLERFWIKWTQVEIYSDDFDEFEENGTELVIFQQFGTFIGKMYMSGT